jgi:hypothetical protein
MSLEHYELGVVTQYQFGNFGRNTLFGQNSFKSVRCVHEAKPSPLRGKPKQRFWHNYARPNNCSIEHK